MIIILSIMLPITILLALVIFIKMLSLASADDFKIDAETCKAVLGAIILSVFAFYLAAYLKKALFIPCLGLFIVIVGEIIHYKAITDLSINWSDSSQARENGYLVTKGIYAYVRHPIYTAFILYGVGLLMYAIYFLGVTFLCISFVIKRINREEANLIKKYGEEYIKYKEKTPYKLFYKLY